MSVQNNSELTDPTIQSADALQILRANSEP